MKYLVYKSDANLNKIDLLELLRKARSKNQELDITGVLVTHAKGFVQYIEGREDAIDNLYKVISADSRHNNVTTISEGSLSTKAYKDWDMGYLCLSDRQALNGIISDDSQLDIEQFHSFVDNLLPMVEVQAANQ